MTSFWNRLQGNSFSTKLIASPKGHGGDTSIAPSGQGILQVPMLTGFSIRTALLHLSIQQIQKFCFLCSFSSYKASATNTLQTASAVLSLQSSHRSGPFGSMLVLSVFSERTKKQRASLGQQLHHEKKLTESPLSHAVFDRCHNLISRAILPSSCALAEAAAIAPCAQAGEDGLSHLWYQSPLTT